MACGNNKVSRDYLASQPSALNVGRYALIARAARQQAAGTRVKEQARVVAGAGNIPRAQAAEVNKLLRTSGLKPDTSTSSPQRSTGRVAYKHVPSGRPDSGTHYAFGGLGRPDGPGHGHMVVRDDGTAWVWRDPFDPLRYHARYDSKRPDDEQYVGVDEEQFWWILESTL